MPRGVAVANIYVVNVKGGHFSVITYSDLDFQLMLCMFYLEKRKIVTTRGLNLLTYPVYLKINLLSLLFLLILKIRNPLSFVISIINLHVVLFLTITN